MTNYNERLDEILGIFSGGITGKGSDRGGYPTYFTEPYPIWCEARKNEAKQAITSLIKELVAEAKPKKPKHIEITEPIVGIDRLWQQGRDIGYASGQADAIDKFEQNLLKALEEV